MQPHIPALDTLHRFSAFIRGNGQRLLVPLAAAAAQFLSEHHGASAMLVVLLPGMACTFLQGIRPTVRPYVFG